MRRPSGGSRRVRHWSTVDIQLLPSFKEQTQPCDLQHLVQTRVDIKTFTATRSVLCVIQRLATARRVFRRNTSNVLVYTICSGKTCGLSGASPHQLGRQPYLSPFTFHLSPRPLALTSPLR
jgi:hypothetical protein